MVSSKMKNPIAGAGNGVFVWKPRKFQSAPFFGGVTPFKW
ncbi:hypothetical protein ACVIRO_007364 [Rhizobium ruizarguesonis]